LNVSVYEMMFVIHLAEEMLKICETLQMKCWTDCK